MLTQQTARVRYNGNAATLAFTVPWYFLASDHLRVVLRSAAGVDVVQTNVTHYTVTGAGDPNGGTVTMVTPPAVGTVLAIMRDVPLTQEADYIANTPFPAEAHETALDKLTMMDTQWAERMERAMKLRDTDGLMGGVFQGGGNRISDIADPVDDNDVATKLWVLAQISNPVGWTPDKDTAQWNADRLQGYSVANLAPADGDALTWSTTNNRWEPSASTAASLLSADNIFTGLNTFNNVAGLFATFGITAGPNGAGHSATLLGNGAGILFSGLAQRIRGDFNNANRILRTIFQSKTAGNTSVGVVPHTVGDASYDVFGAPDPDNSPIVRMACNPTNALIDCLKTGTGTQLPLDILVGSAQGMRIQTTGRIGVNTVTDNGAQMNVNGMVSRNAACFMAHKNGGADQVVATGTFTKVTFTTEDWDQAGWFDLVNDRFLPLIAGKYRLTFQSEIIPADTVSGRRMACIIYKNGVLHRVGVGGSAASTAGAEALGGHVSVTVDANGSTDYFEAYVWHNMGANASFTSLASNTYFCGEHIG